MAEDMDEEKDNSLKSESSSFLNKKVFFTIFLVLIALTAGTFIGLNYQGNPNPYVTVQSSDNSSDNTDSVTCAPNEGTQNALSEEEISGKVKVFLEESDTIFAQDSLKDSGMSVNIKSVSEYGDGFYQIPFEIIKDGETQGSLEVFASKSGEYIFFREPVDLSEPIEFEATPTPTPVEIPKTDKPNVKMFVMSYCPYGQQAETGLKPVAELLSESIEFEPHFVIYSDYASGYPEYCIDEENKYCSMHGVKELEEGVRQLCIWKYNKELFWDYVSKVNQNCSLEEIDSCWKIQAEEVGIDVSRIEKCFDEEAFDLLAAEKELNNEFSVRGSPTILVNDTPYSGGRAPENFKQAICSAFNEAPEECSQALSEEGSNASGEC